MLHTGITIPAYTEEAKQSYRTLIESDLEVIWQDIESTPESTDAEKWKKKLETLAEEYTFTSRFALMRLMAARSNQPIDPADLSKGFSVTLSDGTPLTFPDITLRHAVSLSSQELTHYEQLLTDIASRQADANPEEDTLLIRKALRWERKKGTLLTREEAFRLGHILDFSLGDMDWFLLRVFHVDGGFHYNHPEDMVEAYGFLTHASHHRVAELKQDYAVNYGDISAAPHEDRAIGWTKDMGTALPTLVNSWSVDNRDEQFLRWLGEKAPGLSAVSATAREMYRRLACFAYDWVTNNMLVPEEEFVRRLGRVLQAEGEDAYYRETLFEGDTPSKTLCKEVADQLLKDNQVYAASPDADLTKSWRVMKVKKDDSIGLSSSLPNSRTRVRDLLMGSVDPEKGDFLYLIWFMANQCWIFGKPAPDNEALWRRLNDFIDVCDRCLEAAGLSAFYPPHLVEQSMLLSIVYAAKDAKAGEPTEVYEQMCHSLIQRRNRQPGKKAKQPEA